METSQLVIIFGMIVYAIYKQTRVAPAGGEGRFRLAVIYAAVGVVAMGSSGWRMPDPLGWLFLLGGIGLSAIAGFARGYLTRVWIDREGRRLRQGTWLTVSLFVAVILIKIALNVIAQVADINDGSSFGEVLIIVSIMVAIQAEIVHRRALALPEPAQL